MRLVKDEWEVEQLQDAIDSTILGFEDSVREWANVVEHGERWLEGTFLRRARADGNDVGYESHRRRRTARDHPALDRERRPGRRPAS